MRPCAVLLPAALILTGCARYAPEPLAATASTAAAPFTAELAAIRRPYLVPATIDLSQPLDGNAIATIALINNPDLKAQRARAGISEAQAFQARLLPDPTFSIGASRVLAGPDPLLDIVSALGFDLQQLRTRGVRVAAAQARARQVRLDLAWAEWQAAGQARLQAVRVLVLDDQLAIARASQASARSLLDRTLRAAGRGDLAPSLAQAARAAAFSADEQVRTTERDRTTARYELSRLLGLPATSELRLARPELARPLPSAATLIDLAMTRRDDLAALRAGYDAQEAALHQAILEQFPTLALTLNGARDSAGNLLVGPAIDFALPLWNRNRGGIAVERATRTSLHAEYDARLAQARAEIAAAVAGIAHAQQQRAAAASRQPELERFAQASRRAADRGDLPAATAEVAEQAVRDDRLLVVQAGQQVAEQLIALELLTGSPRESWPR